MADYSEQAGSFRHRRPTWRTGTTITEYAAIIAVTLGSAALGIMGLGHALANSMGAVTHELAAEGDSAQPPSGRLPQRFADRHRPEPATTAGGSRLWLAALAATALIGVGAGTLLGHRRRAAERKQTGEDQQKLPSQMQARFVQKRQQIFKILRSEPHRLFEHRLEVGQIMTLRPATVSLDTGCDQLRDMMRENKVRHLLVCDKQGRLAGLISDRDLHQRRGKNAADLMTRHPITVSPHTPVNQAISTMLTQTISCLPVVDEGKLCGILTSTDLLMALQCCTKLLWQIAREVNLPTAEECPSAGPRPGKSAGIGQPSETAA